MIDSITMDPPPFRWAEWLWMDREGECLGRPLGEWRALTRRELFDDSVSPVIATGHQAQVWHAGILARYLALDAAGAALGAAAVVELLVDQDDNDAATVRVPECRDGRLRVGTVSLSGVPGPVDVPTGRRPAVGRPRLNGALAPASSSVADGLRAIQEAFTHAADEPSLARQAAMATARLRGITFGPTGGPGGIPRHLVAASELTRTTLWRAAIERMREDPAGCIDAYNRAVAAAPADARLGMLDAKALEVPLWRLAEDGRRVRAFAADLENEGAVLWPRGLMMTGLFRLAACDLFLQGLGGALYDGANRRWFRDWLGAELCPAVTVSATLRLSLECGQSGAADLERAIWWAHHLPHNIEKHVEDDGPQREVERLLSRIERSPRGSFERESAFQDLHRIRRSLVEARRDLVREAEAGVEQARRRLGERAVADDRTWPFAFHGADERRLLQDRIERAFAGVREAARA